MDACSSAYTTEMMDLDQQLAQLLGTMSIQNAWNQAQDLTRDVVPNMAYATPKAQDDCMSDSSSDTEDSSTPYQANPLPSSSSTLQTQDESVPRPSAPCGCALLQAIQGQLYLGRYPTTGGDYLEAIFTHREMLFAFPQAHRDCALGFSGLAEFLECREWRADREGDAEAVAAFRHEAGFVAHVVPW